MTSRETQRQNTLSSASHTASSSSSTHDVFPSFSGEDVRRNFLSHVHKEFQRKGIITFKDNGIERSLSIGPELIRSIQESRIAIVVLSKNYASSSWCLNELLEIMKCRETVGQRVMTVFFQVDPSDVRKQTGEFGKAFKRTCKGRSREEKRRWKNALTEVANIAGYDSEKWDDEADMIERIATDVSIALNFTPSRDFAQLVGMETHMRNITKMLCMESSEVRFVGIWGPAGIGKTTIARALFECHSTNFPLRYFMANIKGSFPRTNQFDSYDLSKYLQQLLLSGILDQKGIKIHHLGVAPERLKHHKVFLILDDVDKTEQLEALAKDTQWFGSGSRVVVTTQHRGLLEAHGINHIYQVPFPCIFEALGIFSRYAFRQSSPLRGFFNLAVEITELAGRLPLGLSILGSSLRGKSKEHWDLALPRLRRSLDCDIETKLKFGFDCLSDEDKSIFLHIACLFHDEKATMLSQLLAESDLDIAFGLKVLDERSLINIDDNGYIRMHELIRRLGRKIVHGQSNHNPRNRQFLVDAKDIYVVFADNMGTKAEAVLGISVDAWKLPDKLVLSDKTFENFPNLQFLYIIIHDNLEVSEDLAYLPPKLRLLQWYDYPLKTLPSRFSPQFLVKLDIHGNKLEKLWEGTQPLENLIEMDLSFCVSLRELPDLSKATNLQQLLLYWCSSLVTLPSHNINLESLRDLKFNGCSELQTFPDFSRNIETLNIDGTAIGEVPSSIRQWTRLTYVSMEDCENLKTFPQLPDSVKYLDLSGTKIEEIPPWIEDLTHLTDLTMSDCDNLKVISPNLWKLAKLETLYFEGCTCLTSLHAEIICDFQRIPNYTKHLSHREVLDLMNCSKMNQEEQQFIDRLGFHIVLFPGSVMPEEFVHQATGSSLTIPSYQIRTLTSFRFKVCLVLGKGSPLYLCNPPEVRISCRLSDEYDGRRRFQWTVKERCDRFFPGLRSPFLERKNCCLTADHLCDISDVHAVIDGAPEAVKSEEMTQKELLFEFNCPDMLGDMFADGHLCVIKRCGVALLDDLEDK